LSHIIFKIYRIKSSEIKRRKISAYREIVEEIKPKCKDVASLADFKAATIKVLQ
jgi:hypothetical protein